MQTLVTPLVLGLLTAVILSLRKLVIRTVAAAAAAAVVAVLVATAATAGVTTISGSH